MNRMVSEAEMIELESVSPEKFNFQIVLNAPVATGDHVGDGQATYLNQGKTYHLSILDTASNLRRRTQTRYQTHIRILFERGNQESEHYRRLRSWNRKISVNSMAYKRCVSPGLDFAPLNQNDGVGISPSQLVLKHKSFDSFCLTWNSSRTTGASYCVIPLRLNFFSTDFSCREAAEGKPMTLFVRTERLMSTDAEEGLAEQSEDCYLKVKLFLESTSETELGNIFSKTKGFEDDFKILQPSLNPVATLHSEELPERSKRSRSTQSGKGFEHYGSFSNSCSNEGMEIDEKIDEQRGIAIVQEASSCLLPVSTFHHLSSYEGPPNECCVSLNYTKTTEMTMRPKAKPVKITSSPNLTKSSPATILHTNINRNRPLPGKTAGQHKPKNGLSVIPEEYSEQSTGRNNAKARLSPPDPPSDESKSLMPMASRSGATPPPLRHLAQEATLPNDSYPQDVDKHPNVCFYVRSSEASNSYHRAIYLTERTMDALVAGIGAKYGVAPETVGQITYFDAGLVQSRVDEEVIKMLPNGQDIIIRLASTQDHPLSRAPASDITCSKISRVGPNLPTPLPSSQLQSPQDFRRDVNLDIFVNFEYAHGTEGILQEELQTFQGGRTLPGLRRNTNEQLSSSADSQESASKTGSTPNSPSTLIPGTRLRVRSATESISPSEFSSTLNSTPDLAEASSVSSCSSIARTKADGNNRKRKREPPE